MMIRTLRPFRVPKGKSYVPAVDLLRFRLPNKAIITGAGVLAFFSQGLSAFFSEVLAQT
jgi:hypothetical protein